MTKLYKFLRGEPALVLSLVGASLGAATSFGLSLSTAQTNAVYGFTAALIGVLIRQVVSPTP